MNSISSYSTNMNAGHFRERKVDLDQQFHPSIFRIFRAMLKTAAHSYSPRVQLSQPKPAYIGGGPYREMFRRTAHWLMGEPELDAETLSAVRDGDNLVITRKSLDDVNSRVSVISPDGTTRRIALDRITNGLYRATLPLQGQGAYRLQSDDISTITAVGALNPKEYNNLLPTEDVLTPLSEATNGLIKSVQLSASNVPNVRRTSPGRATNGNNWMGLVSHDAYTVTQSRRTPLAPGLFIFALFFLFLAWAWRREGK